VQHDLRRETVGYIENFHVIPDPDAPRAWLLKGDVYCTSGDFGTALRAFSPSFMKGMVGPHDPAYAIYVPYPHYRDSEFIRTLAERDDALQVGKWAKKSVGEPLAVALLIDFAFFLLAPALDKVFNEAIRPTLERFFTTLPALRARGLSADFVETLKGRSGERYAAHFIPVRGREELCLSRDAIRGGLQQLQEYVSSD